MSFGPSNILASFQRYINKILAEKLDIFVIVYLDNILIYTKDAGQSQVKAILWILGKLRKHGLFANLKKCCFHQEEVCFLGYVVSSQRIRMEEERIDAVKAWLEPKSIRDIQVFIGFANFYRRFIQGFSKIAALLTSMLKTSAKPAGVLPAIGVDNKKVFGSSGGNKKKSAKSNFTKPMRGAEELSFLTLDTRRAFTQLRQAFTEAIILRHFDPKHYIRIKTNASGYAIGSVLS